MNIAIVLSGGTGSRLNAFLPKQYIKVGGEDIITRCLRTLYEHPEISYVHIVAAEEWQGEIKSEQGRIPDAERKFRGFSKPGINRQMSIYNALCDMEKYVKASDTVLIHDAARPYLTRELITRIFQTMKGHDGAMPVLPMKDTVYYSDNGKTVSRLLERNCVYAGQAPEAYRFGVYLDVNRGLLPDDILDIHGSTEPAVMAGLDIALLPGDERNFKITTPEDLERFKQYESTGFA